MIVRVHICYLFLICHRAGVCFATAVAAVPFEEQVVLSSGHISGDLTNMFFMHSIFEFMESSKQMIWDDFLWNAFQCCGTRVPC